MTKQMTTTILKIYNRTKSNTWNDLLDLVTKEPSINKSKQVTKANVSN